MKDPDYRCYGQGDGTFLCERLHYDPTVVALIGVLITLALFVIVLHIRRYRG